MAARDFRSTILSVLCLCVLAMGSTPAVAEKVAVRAEKTADSGLITFAWQEPVAHRHAIENGRLVVRFSRPIESAYQPLVGALGGLISDAKPGADGRSVSFGLKRPVEVYAYYTGTAVTVELIAKAETVGPDPVPAPAEGTVVEVAAPPMVASRSQARAQAIPADAPRISVRTGEHPDYTRIVFDFAETTPYRISNADGVVTIRFQRPARIDVDALNNRPARLIGTARTSFSGGETVVELAIPATAGIRDFQSGPKIVVDIRQPTGSEDPVALPAVASPSTQAAAVEAAPATAPVSPVEKVAIPAPAAVQPAGDGENGRPRALTADGVAPPTSKSPPPGTAAPAITEQADAELSPRALATSGDTPAQAAKVTAFPGPDQVAFRFDFDEPVAAATFRRGGAVWIVFDKPLTVDTVALKAQAGEAAIEILQIPNNDGTVLRIRTSDRFNPAVKRDGLSWIIDLLARQMAPQSALVVNAQPKSPVGARLFIPVPEPGRPIAISDPNIGDNFIVIPVIPLGQALGRQYRFPQVTLPVAAQGVVINPLTDDLRVRALRQGVELSASGVRLAISNVSDDAAAHAQLAATRPMVRAIDELEKYFAPTGEFRVTRRGYEVAVADAPTKARTAARMELAKFFFANAYAPETLGVLRVAADDIPLLENDPSYRVMRGGANFLLGRYDEALKDFNHESLNDNDEGRMWAAATTAVMGDRIGSARDLRFTGSIARDYPRPLKMPLGILIAEVSAETGDGQGAKLFLDALNLENPTPGEQAMLKFAEGKLKEMDGDVESAIALWEEVIKSDHRPSRARARVALTELLLKLRRITHREAIEEYEKLRFAWRGDIREFNNLRRLGSLYLDDGFYRSGLSTLKEAATYFRDYPEAPEITKQMSDTFNALFLAHQADDLDPVKAIAIYNEFKELTPAGANGDEMIRNLSDKLVQVDLLDRAAGLLTAQVQFRLEGVEKARVGARLALIYLLAQEYQKALEVLQGTDGIAGLPDELTAQRRHLRAQVLMGMNRQGDALRLLTKDESEGAELLRTEMFWNAADWLKAASSLRLLVKLSGAKSGEPLNDIQAARINNYAIALTNSGGERAIVQLLREYGPAMSKTKFAEAFKLVTTPSTVGILSPGAVSSKVQEVETFLAAYRSKLKQGEPLSSMN